jgi:hypothetical protein
MGQYFQNFKRDYVRLIKMFYNGMHRKFHVIEFDT